MKEAGYGTAEFRIEQGDAMRVMFAFFLKSESPLLRSVGGWGPRTRRSAVWISRGGLLSPRSGRSVVRAST